MYLIARKGCEGKIKLTANILKTKLQNYEAMYMEIEQLRIEVCTKELLKR
jgi:hypothetical protein